MKESNDIWEGDLLDREEEAIFLQRYIENVYQSITKDTSFVLNINSEWGHGKTWFLKRLCRQLKCNYPTVYFDAWKNDFTQDALLSFVSVVCNDLSNQFRKDTQIQRKLDFVKTKFKKVVKKSVPIVTAVLTKQLTGLTMESLYGDNSELSENVADTAEKLADVATTCLVEDFLEKKNSIDAFGEAVNSLVSEIKKSSEASLPICVIVDELDRCRPTYAIELLESIKHLFDVNGVVFILATDTKQLSHSIKAVYGSEFSSTSYLKRFFTTEYQLSEPNYDSLSKFLFLNFSFKNRLFLPESLEKKYDQTRFFSATSQYFKLTTREQYQIHDSLSACLLSSDKTIFHLPYLLLLLILKHKYEEESYVLFENPNLNNFNKTLNGIKKKKDIIEQSFQCTNWVGNQGKLEWTTFTDVFQFYFDLLDSDLQISRRGRDGWSYKKEIESNIPATNNLGDYFRVISQAGRIRRRAVTEAI